MPLSKAAAPASSLSLCPPLAAQFDALPPSWATLLAPFIKSPRFQTLCQFVDATCVRNAAQDLGVFPHTVFYALQQTPPERVKVVILGQDPYHGMDNGCPQAHGLAFSVPDGVRPPPSLRNIFKELTAEFGLPPPAHGNLSSWAQQGVLLLNTVLTVTQGAAASHARQGWEACTDTLLTHLCTQYSNIVFLLWGAHAQAKRALIPAHEHCILEAPHPSPLSAHRGFLGCGHFQKANAYLAHIGRTPIDWSL
jgi:uracil-DNA glycosylase